MASCVELIAGLDASCAALNKVGGVKKRVWITQLSQLSATSPYTVGANGYITAITMGTDGSGNDYTLKQFVGKKSKNSIALALTVGPNVNTHKTDFLLALYHFTPADRESIETLINCEDVVVFAETEAGQIEVLGIDQGLNASAGTGGVGVNLQDATEYMLTLSGEQRNLPYLFDTSDPATPVTTGLASSKAHLDALS
jgi:hypothetical protein